jgi:hypothetical protein
MLGDPPSSVAGRQAWCALAYEIETYRDHHPDAIGHEHEQAAQAAIGPWPSSLSDRMSWDHLTRRIADGAGIVALADSLPVQEQPGLGEPARWSERLDDAFEAWGAGVAIVRDAPSLGIDL